MTRNRASVYVAAALIVVAASWGLAALFSGNASPEITVAVAPPDGPGAAPSGASTQGAELDRLIGVFEGRVAENPADLTNLAFLGELYLRKATLTDDLPSYLRAVDALARTVAQWTDNYDATSSLARARLGTHEFSAAVEAAERVLEAEPDRLDAIAALGDAELALGNLEATAAAYDRLEELLPQHPAIEVRQSRLAFIEGDTDRAVALAAAAGSHAESSGLTGPELAFYFEFRAEIQFDLGRFDQAAVLYERALAAVPGNPGALAGLAMVTAAAGDLETAAELYRRAAAAGSDPGLAIALGDVYLALGDVAAAEAQFEEAESAALAAGETSTAYDLTLALFYADHARRPAEALRLAETELAARPSVFTYDAHAWALYRNGRYQEARESSDRALAFATAEAPFWYHAGLISAALGDTDRAIDELGTALDLNPAFDPIHAPEAQRVLAELGG